MTRHRTGVKLTYQDYVRIPEDGQRHEILDGVHVVTPAPVPYHQALSKRLLVQLYDAVEKGGLGTVYCAPIDVLFGPHDIAQPDLVVILTANLSIVTDRAIEGTPDMVVEILSPTTSRRDRTTKKARYEAFGVREYWIVDPDAKVVEQLVLEQGRYVSTGSFSGNLRLAVLPEVTVDLSRIW